MQFLVSEAKDDLRKLNIDCLHSVRLKLEWERPFVHLLAHRLKVCQGGWVLRSWALCTVWLREPRLSAKDGEKKTQSIFPSPNASSLPSLWGSAEIVGRSELSCTHDFEPWAHSCLGREWSIFNFSQRYYVAFRVWPLQILLNVSIIISCFDGSVCFKFHFPTIGCGYIER